MIKTGTKFRMLQGSQDQFISKDVYEISGERSNDFIIKNNMRKEYEGYPCDFYHPKDEVIQNFKKGVYIGPLFNFND